MVIQCVGVARAEAAIILKNLAYNIFFLFALKQFIRGMTVGAVKG